MTVATSTSRIEYTGDAVTTAFSFPYYFLANGDLKVYLNGVLQTITTHYTVTGATNPAGGTVTFVTAPPNTQLVVIYREVALTQSVDYSPNDPFPANTHEQALDRLTMIDQQQDEEIGRALKLPSTSTYSDLTVPDPQAGYYLQWKADLSGLQNVVEVSPTNITVSAFGATLVDDADAAAALTTLGLGGMTQTGHEINQGVEYANQYMAHENSTPGMTVLIDAGRMMYNGTLVSNAQQTVTINAADATNPRIDRITISESTGVYTYTAGTAAASPTAPAIPAGQLPICQVSVPALDTTISNSQITDERVFQAKSSFNGAKRSGSTDSSIGTSGTILTFGTAEFDTDGFFSTNSRITIPAKFNGCYVEVTTQFEITSYGTGKFARILYNGSSTDASGCGNLTMSINDEETEFQVTTGPVLVSTGDYFESRLATASGTTSMSGQNFMAIKVLK